MVIVIELLLATSTLSRECVSGVPSSLNRPFVYFLTDNGVEISVSTNIVIDICVCLVGKIDLYRGLDATDFMLSNKFHSESLIGQLVLDDFVNESFTADNKHRWQSTYPIYFQSGSISIMKTHTCFAGYTQVFDPGKYRFVVK